MSKSPGEWLTRKLKLSQKCPECGASPPGVSPTTPAKDFFIKKKNISDRLFKLECPECGHNFSAYICIYCDSVYHKLSVFQQTNFSSPVTKYKCLCGKSALKIKQDHRYC